MIATYSRYTPQRRGAAWRSRLLALVMLALALGGGFLPGMPARSALAAPREYSSGTDRVLFKGKVYEATQDASYNVIIKNTTKDGATRGSVNLGNGAGNFQARPTMAADRDQRFLIVFAKYASGGSIRFARTTDGVNWSNWIDLEGVASDLPQAYAVNDVVAVSVTGSDGNTKYMKYTNAADGSSFTGWNVADGKEIPLSTAIMNRTYPYESALGELRSPEVLRARVFHGLNSTTPLLGTYDLDRFVALGVRTMVLNTRDEVRDVADFNNQIFSINIYSTAAQRTPGAAGGSQTIAGWCAAQTMVNCIVELGNEPDRVQEYYRTHQSESPPNSNPGSATGYWGPEQTRARAMDIIADFDNNRRAQNQNLRLMISLPTTGSNGFFVANGYFDTFTASFSHAAYNPYGTSRVGDAFDAVAAHTYAFDCIARRLADGTVPGNPEGPGSPMHAVFKAVDNSSRPVYITEFNINSSGWWSGSEYGRWDEIGPRLVSALNAFDIRDGRIRGAMAFQSDYNPDFAPGATGPYNIDQNAGDWIGHRHMGLGDTSSYCSNIDNSYRNTR
jgi:hypothetical protein